MRRRGPDVSPVGERDRVLRGSPPAAPRAVFGLGWDSRGGLDVRPLGKRVTRNGEPEDAAGLQVMTPAPVGRREGGRWFGVSSGPQAGKDGAPSPRGAGLGASAEPRAREDPAARPGRRMSCRLLQGREKGRRISRRQRHREALLRAPTDGDQLGLRRT